jgi:hypothetical protein
LASYRPLIGLRVAFSFLNHRPCPFHLRGYVIAFGLAFSLAGAEITFGLGPDLGDNGAFGLGLGLGLGLGPDLGGCGALGGGGVLTVCPTPVLGNGVALPPPKPGSDNNELGSICGLLGEGAGLLCRLGLSGSNKRIAVPSALVPTLGLIPPFPAATTSS